MRKIDEEIRLLELQISDLDRKISALAELAIVYPDLIVHSNKEGVKKYCSASVNDYVNTMEVVNQCSCCDGAPLILYAYCVVNDIRIYSDPPHFQIGFANRYGFGQVPLTNWKDDLKDAGISKLVMDKASDYLKRHPPVDYDDVED